MCGVQTATWLKKKAENGGRGRTRTCDLLRVNCQGETISGDHYCHRLLHLIALGSARD